MFVMQTFIPAGQCMRECAAFMALCDLVDLLQIVNLGKCSPTQLRNVVDCFLRSCVDAGWEQYFIPKFHWLVHLPDHLATFCCLVVCWVHERKHRVAKRYGGDIRNTRSMERSVLSEVVAHNLNDLTKPGVFDLSPGLVKPVAATAKIISFIQAHLEPTATCADIKKAFKARVLPPGIV